MIYELILTIPYPHVEAGLDMDTSHDSQFERPRKRGRPLTYEEKWMVHHVFEAFENDKQSDGIVSAGSPKFGGKSQIALSSGHE